MKSANKRFTIIASFLILSIISCSNNRGGSSYEGIGDADMKKPKESSLVYTDYSQESRPNHLFDGSKWYKNDLNKVNMADPFIYEEDGVFYIYGTTDRVGSRGFDCWETTDFSTYKNHMNIYQKAAGHWAGTAGGMFAPELLHYGDKYYLYYSDQNDDFKDGNRRISVAVADNPIGPFSAYKGKNAYGQNVDGDEDAIFAWLTTDVGYSVLDQNVFVDEDGELYMYYSVYHTGVMQYIVGMKMLDPVTLDTSTKKVLIEPGVEKPGLIPGIGKDYLWERFQGFRVAEGPEMIKSPNGKYYLTYSVNHYPDRYYTVCYAYSDDPLGDFIKPYKAGQQWTNILFGYGGGLKSTKVYDQWEGFQSGTAHHCFFRAGDQWMIGYHAHINRKDSSNGRAVGIDKLFFDDKGEPYVHGPSYSLQPHPEYISGYSNIALTSKIYTKNISHPERLNDNYIVEHYNLDAEKNKEASLSKGKSYIKFNFGKKMAVGGIAIYNSATYQDMTESFSYINFGKGNCILDGVFPYFLSDVEKEFVFPCSAFAYDFADIETDYVVIGFDSAHATKLNEIAILGREI